MNLGIQTLDMGSKTCSGSANGGSLEPSTRLMLAGNVGFKVDV